MSRRVRLLPSADAEDDAVFLRVETTDDWDAFLTKARQKLGLPNIALVVRHLDDKGRLTRVTELDDLETGESFVVRNSLLLLLISSLSIVRGVTPM